MHDKQKYEIKQYDKKDKMTVTKWDLAH